ncbi:MAG: competence protein ComEC, partial [Gammaproteobacteria bacterium]|nr:competence protein ComEC [Gammaproteobacteria bacterium]
CVLRVTLADGQRLLLPGDIEAVGERDLLEHHGGDLSADVLVVPHHGSRTSSTAAFVSAVNPAVALIPAGYLNRYRFPHPDVVARYTDIGSELHQTGHTGAIMVRMVPGAGRPRIVRYRRDSPRLWRRSEQPPSRFGY